MSFLCVSHSLMQMGFLMFNIKFFNGKFRILKFK